MVLTSKLTAPAINVASLTFVIATGASSCAIIKMFLPKVCRSIWYRIRFANIIHIAVMKY